jgi:hypothetical protein
MTHQAPFSAAAPGADPGRQVAQLREALRLVERIAGLAEGASGDARLDEAARISAAYDRAVPIIQRRFDALAGETAAWTAAGVEALLAAGRTTAPRAAAARLAAQIDQALADLSGLLASAEPL